MLVHICCSVDSHYFLQKIKEDYPDENIVGFFYDPNIHPYSEYRLRLFDVQKSCDILNIELIEGVYDLDSWLQSVKGLENEPEKGSRCTVCFNKRLEITAQKAQELNHKSFTTTLLMSPKKSQDKLLDIGNQLTEKYMIDFIFKDYRIKNGIELQGKEVKKHQLYRQNYCGCMFGLLPQREQQDKFPYELISPIGKQIQPQSIEYRLELYEKLKHNPDLNIIKQKFLNYRLLSAKVVIDNIVAPSYFLFYSTIDNYKTKGKIEKIINNIGYFNRQEIKIITLEYFNKLANTKYTNLKELIYNPPLLELELNIRDKIVQNSYDLSAIIILDILPKNKLDIFCNSTTFSDTKEDIKV